MGDWVCEHPSRQWKVTQIHFRSTSIIKQGLALFYLQGLGQEILPGPQLPKFYLDVPLEAPPSWSHDISSSENRMRFGPLPSSATAFPSDTGVT